MEKKAQRIRLGVFVFIATAALTLLIVYFAANQLFEKTDVYYINYQDVSVSGLEVGSPVEYLGIRIGTISNISINPRDINSIIVELSVTPGTPIKEDARADIVTMGITGLKAIEIRGGTNEAESLQSGDYINAGSSTTEEITGRANVIAEKVEQVINNLQSFTEPDNLGKVTTAVDNINLLSEKLTGTVGMVDSIVRENRTEIRTTFGNASQITEQLNETSLILDETVKEIRQVITGDTLQRILGNAHDITVQLRESDLKKLIGQLVDVTEQTRVLLTKIDQELEVNSEEFNESVRLLRVILTNLEETSNKISSDPSILIRGQGEKDIPDDRLR